MSGSRSFLVLAMTLALGACTPVSPAGPRILVVPPEGKDLARFQQEDETCRQYAAARIDSEVAGQAAPQGVAGSSASLSSVELQRRYDIAYLQCMAARGNQLPSFQAISASLATKPHGRVRM